MQPRRKLRRAPADAKYIQVTIRRCGADSGPYRRRRHGNDDLGAGRQSRRVTSSKRLHIANSIYGRQNGRYHHLHRQLGSSRGRAYALAAAFISSWQLRRAVTFRRRKQSVQTHLGSSTSTNLAHSTTTSCICERLGKLRSEINEDTRKCCPVNFIQTADGPYQDETRTRQQPQNAKIIIGTSGATA